MLWILASLRQRETHTRLGSLLTDDYFPGALALVRQAIRAYWVRNRTESEARVEGIRLLLRRLPGAEKSGALELLTRVAEFPTIPALAVEQHLADFIKRESLRRMALEVAGGVDRPQPLDPEVYLRRLRDLSGAFLKDQDRVIEYARAPSEYWNLLTTGRIPTGISELDQALRGGLGPGELGLVIAPWSGGKSTALINLGAHAMTLGKRVLHLTLEMNHEEVLLRYDMRLAGVTDEGTRDRARIAAVRKQIQAAKGGLLIRDCSHERITPLRLEALVERFSQKQAFDLLIIDYLDLVNSDARELEGRFNTADVYRETRRVGSVFHLPIWTASQTTREASKTGIFSANDVAEDISKMRTCDVGVCLLQTDHQRNRSEMVLRLDKSRTGAKKPQILLTMDYDIMTWKEKTPHGSDPGHRPQSSRYRSRVPGPGGSVSG